jgi:hypothetical protein
VNAKELNLGALNSGWGDPVSLDRMTCEIAAFNNRLAAEGNRCSQSDLRAIQNLLSSLAIEIARMEHAVSDRIATLNLVTRHGN